MEGCIQFNASVAVHKDIIPEKHIPRGWSASYIGEGEYKVLLSWESSILDQIDAMDAMDYRLRITNAADYRDEQQIRASLTQSGENIGAIEVRYSYAFQYFELMLTKELVKRVIAEGLTLTCPVTAYQLWIFNDDNNQEQQHYFVPHILVVAKTLNKTNAAIQSLLSNKSLQPFGWIEGSVLDGIDSLMQGETAEQAAAALAMHLQQYVSSDGHLTYEDLHGNIADGSFTTIEATLPVAIIAKHDPNHPLIDKAMAFFQQRMMALDLIIDHDMVSAEGCYTVAYPLAVIAKATNNEKLAEQAVSQLLLRKTYLAQDQHIYLRYMLESEVHTFKNWSRAYGWYFLGFVKTYVALKDFIDQDRASLEQIREEIVRVSALVMEYRQAHGLWNVFLDKSKGVVEASGSAAIAAALAIAAKGNIIDERYLVVAKDCYEALTQHITSDGLLHQVSQHNAGGMQLQLSDYRVLSQMGLGLWGQLHSALFCECTA